MLDHKEPSALTGFTRSANWHCNYCLDQYSGDYFAVNVETIEDGGKKFEVRICYICLKKVFDKGLGEPK